MTADAGVPAPVFDHLDALTDSRGLFEHALLSVPRREHGYCVDDVARGLVVVCREQSPDLILRRLGRCYLDFVLAAIDTSGACHNRMDTSGRWRDSAGTGDWWGRALWGLGIAAASGPTAGARARALAGFRIAAQQRSPYPRSMAFAALGAGALIGARPMEQSARDLLQDAVPVGVKVTDPAWPWPEPRLSYGNGALAESLIVAGRALADAERLARGLHMLQFLLSTETRDGHLSVTPVGGRGRGDAGPGFDQQPIEVAALADACATAYRITGDAQWLEGIRLAWRWFLGDNDGATVMFDPRTGGGYDGLEFDGHNRNQGAESTLAMLSTAQQARQVAGIR